jgi:hypothetical protein
MEVAVEIMKSGRILCRSAVPRLICDVANQGAIWNNPQAHDFVRLYFRPKNWFHLKTEGVKPRADRYRVDPHMSMPVCLVFDLPRVLAISGAGVVPGNFAKSNSAPLYTDEGFRSLDFESVYHEGPLADGLKVAVNEWRMSEVVVPGELDLRHLSAVVCRSIHEERTLRHLLQQADVKPSTNILVEQRNSIFVRRGIFIDELYWQNDFLHMKFHGPVVAAQDAYDVNVTCIDQGSIKTLNFQLSAKKYYFPSMPATRDAVWRIEIEGCCVYHARVPSLSGLV